MTYKAIYISPVPIYYVTYYVLRPKHQTEAQTFYHLLGEAPHGTTAIALLLLSAVCSEQPAGTSHRRACTTSHDSDSKTVLYC